MGEPVLVAAGQFHAHPRQLKANTNTTVELIDEAATQGAKLLVLPEFCISGYDPDWIQHGAPGGAIDSTSPVVATMAEVGADLAVTVVFNDLERWQNRLYSTSFILAQGSLVGRHRKSIITENETRAGLSAGEAAATPVTIPGIPVPIAPLICFEHGFPEIALDLALAGTGLIAISSAIPIGTEYLRNLRTRARAQDNGCYVVAANAVGNGYCGESLVVDPRGDVLARASATGRELIVAELDPELITDQRRREPVLRLRRPDLRTTTKPTTS